MINSLYVHIPFCRSKCLYCDFNSYSGKEALEESYINALIKEIDNIKCSKFETIFIGGGTPTILNLNEFSRLLKRLSCFNAEEFTVEANPGTVSKERAEILKGYGVNRVSMGLQAWQDDHLKRLGRIHTIKEFCKSYELLRKSGIENINIDIMSGLPFQSMEELEETLENVAELKPEHISSYSLIVEEGTPLWNEVESGKFELPGEDTEMDMYWRTEEILNSFGYNHYEISNYALKGYECRHNITYWKEEEYYGVGAGAHSFVNGERYSNICSINEYIEGINGSGSVCQRDILKPEDFRSEFMFLGLRMLKGISIKEFKDRFNIDIYDVYGKEISELIKLKLITEEKDSLSLTKRGIEVSNQVFEYFI